MRVRTYRARVTLHLILTLALVVPAVTLPDARAMAEHCTGETRIDERGGEVGGECHGEEPGRPGSSSMSDLWARYCSDDAGPYLEGDEVAFYESGPPSPEDLEARGLDPSGEYMWFHVICWRDGREAVEIPIIIEVTPPVSPVVLRDRAMARIDPPAPTPVTSPPLERFAVVRLPTWLWLDSAYWQPVEVSETQGSLTVTVRATPIEADWVMGDGGGVTCAGPGVEWRSGLEEEDTVCSYTYLHSSYGVEDGRFDASVTVVWEFEWWLNGGYQGSFGSVDVSTPFGVAVGEIQAIETTGG